MIGALRRRRARQAAARVDDCAAKAGALYDGGYNCAQAVLQASTGRSDPELLAMAEAFGGGIGASGCLCGAVTGGVMALGLKGQGTRSGEVILWEMPSRRRKRTLEHAGACVAFSPDGKTLATGSKSGGIALWDPNTGKLVKDLV